MKWIMLAIGLVFLAEFAVTRMGVSAIWGVIFLIASASIWRDDDVE